MRRHNFSREVLPVRLIDICATLSSEGGGIHFVVPSSWDFHVLSHTWSLEVRNFSTQIGQQIVQQDDDGDHQRSTTSTLLYNAYFQQADLRGDPAFRGLLQFLSLLPCEGVAFVWFDALCIDQTNDREKEREIAHMGAYYSNSRGCYVILHGIGRGYHFWNEHDFVGVLPRWFSRVWTLQELILPAQLSFVTELPQRVQRHVRGLVQLKSSSSVGFCKCCILEDLLTELHDSLPPAPRAQFLRSCGVDVEYIDSSESADGVELVFSRLSTAIDTFCGDSSTSCPTCGVPSLIRPCEHHNLNTGGCSSGCVAPPHELYMVEREAYLFLTYFDTFFPLNHTYGNIPRIVSLIKNLDQQVWDPWNVFIDIGARECTNDEDRVLGVLGLLGVGGAMQVRTREFAEQQLINLGRHCISEDPDLLHKLCVAQPIGMPILGMSWAPSLQVKDFVYEYTGEVCGFSSEFIDHCFGDQFEQDAYPSAHKPLLDMSIVRASLAHVISQLDRLSGFERKVDFLDCTVDGITLEACVASGKVLPYRRLQARDRATIRNAVKVANASASSILRKNHKPTHCIWFEKSGVFLPVLVSLMQEQSRTTFKSEPVLVMADALRPWNIMYLNLPTCKHAKARVSKGEDFLHYVEDGQLRIELDVWVLLLGIANGYSVSIVCVGYNDMELHKLGIGIPEISELHKVGIFVLPTSVSNEMFARAEGSKLRYLLGGHGDDLSMFVKMRSRCCCK